MIFYNIYSINNTILKAAFESKNVELVKHILSLNQLDIKSENIFFNIFNEILNYFFLIIF